MTKLVHITTVPMTFMFFRGQIEFMRERGYEICAISSPGARLDQFGRSEDVETYGVEMPRQITPFRDLGAVVETTRILRDIEPDIVHSHTPKGGLLGMIAATVAGVPIRVYHMRGLPLTTATGAKRALLTATERIACGLAHRVICVSESLRRVALDEDLVDRERIDVLANGSSNGVDAKGRFNPDNVAEEARQSVREEFGIGEDARVIGFVGRLVRDKGVVELADAWNALSRRFDNAHLLVVGPFEARDAVPGETVEILESSPRVHLPGFCDNIVPMYAAMDVIAFPSHREGFPNVPLEAAAMELPVVAANAVGSIDAVEDGETGIIVPAGDGRRLADALARYLESPELRSAHGRAGRERVLEKYRPELIWEALEETYRELEAERLRG